MQRRDAPRRPHGGGSGAPGLTDSGAAMTSMLYKNGYCLVLESKGDKTRIAPYENCRP
jgi:hypothetical protein